MNHLMATATAIARQGCWTSERLLPALQHPASPHQQRNKAHFPSQNMLQQARLGSLAVFDPEARSSDLVDHVDCSPTGIGPRKLQIRPHLLGYGTDAEDRHLRTLITVHIRVSSSYFLFHSCL